MVNVVAGTEEDIEVVSRENVKINWCGTLTIYSGSLSGEQISGHNYFSGESPIQPISTSGQTWMRISELNVVNKAIVIPKNPRYVAVPDYISGNVMRVQFQDIMASGHDVTQDTTLWTSGCFLSGQVDVFAWGR